MVFSFFYPDLSTSSLVPSLKYKIPSLEKHFLIYSDLLFGSKYLIKRRTNGEMDKKRCRYQKLKIILLLLR